MKIKNKLTLIFTSIIAILLIGLNLYIYLFTRSTTINNFYEELMGRAELNATRYLEADEEKLSTINKFEKKHVSKLPHEIIRIYNNRNQSVYIDSTSTYKFSDPLIEKIRKYKEYQLFIDDRQIVGIYYQDNQGDFVIIASGIDVNGKKDLDELEKVLLAGFFMSLIVVFFAGRYITKIMLEPVSEISTQANRISETNLHLRLDEGNKKDELAELSIVVNRMLERLENAFDLQKNFVANASHELRTPLTSIIGNIEVTLSKARTIEEHKETLESILVEAEKLHKLTNGLLNLAQSNLDFSSLRKEEIRIDELLLELKDEMRVKRAGSTIEILFPEMPENPNLLTIAGDKNLLETAMLNILDNACKFSDGKKVTIGLQLIENQLIIAIADQGIGISPVELPHITETFYRATNARAYSGSGIGLAMAEKIITLHRGKLQIISDLGKGTTVTIIFNAIT